MTRVFWNNSDARMAGVLRGGLLFLGCVCLIMTLISPVWGRSALSPRNSGLEPPGGPKQLEALPGNVPGRTSEGGMGYMDAYGNPVRNQQPQEKKPKFRPRPGAYGGYGKKEQSRPLPDPDEAHKPPLWKFD